MAGREAFGGLSELNCENHTSVRIGMIPTLYVKLGKIILDKLSFDVFNF